MMHVQTLEPRDLALDLHQLLRELDPARFRVEAAHGLRARAQALRERMQALRERAAGRPRLRKRVTELCEIFSRNTPGADAEPDEAAGRWATLRAKAQPAYERLVHVLRAEEGHDLPSLRPTNYLRNVFHVANAAWVVLLAHFVLVPQGWLVPAAVAAFVGAWSMELGRRWWPPLNRALMWVLGGVAHPSEARQINSATWYTTALLLLALFVGPEAGLPALAILGVGDPMAALVGRRFGRTPLVHGRSLEGSLAFWVSGSVAALALIAWLQPAPLPQMLVWSMGPAAVGAVAELLARRVDDNLAIPVAAGVAGVVLRLLGG